jgi:hypothetical protein
MLTSTMRMRVVYSMPRRVIQRFPEPSDSHERLYNGDKRQNVAIELRFADWKLDRLPDLAAELVALKVDVIVALGTPAARAAKQTTSTIPIGTPTPMGTCGASVRLPRYRISAKARLRSSEYGFTSVALPSMIRALSPETGGGPPQANPLSWQSLKLSLATKPTG